MDSVSDLIITTDRLFRAEHPVTLAGRVLSVRALSAIDVKNRFDEGTLASVQARRDMKDPTSRRYRIRVSAVLEEIGDDDLRQLIVNATRNQSAVEAVRTIRAELTPIPDGASEDEQRDVVEERQKDLERAGALRQKFVDARGEQAQVKAAAMDRAALEKEYIRLATIIAIDNAFGEAYEDAGLLYAVRLPSGEPYFSSLDDARALPDEARQKLLEEMRLVNDLDPLRLSGPSSTAQAPVPGS